MRVHRVSSGKFVFENGRDIVAGDAKLIVSMMTKYGVEWNEIEQGLVELIMNQHVVAEYGDINKTFMYTKPAS